jgi:hypothetical protein
VRSPLDGTTIPIGAAALWLVTAFALVYAPDAGHGFVKDDFGWVARSRLSSLHNLAAMLTTAPSGFFRPAVSFSFGIERGVCGLSPRCYGLTNVLLAIACGLSIFRLARSLSLPPGAALFASAVWAFNWHGIGLSVLWISGRTALTVVLLATLAATAFARRHPVRAAVLCFGAMLAKEEAILLPAVLAGWAAVDASPGERSVAWRRLLTFSGLAIGLGGVYWILRSRSGAFTPSTAPPFYQLSFSVSRLLENGPAYLDRSATFAASVVVVYAAIVRPFVARASPATWRILRLAAFWFVGTLAVTVFLPVRASLYACLPAVGAALAAAAVIDATWPSLPPARQRRMIFAGLAAPLLLWPVLAARNRPLVREADLSAQTIGVLRSTAADRGAHATVMLRDDRARKPSFDDVFGTQAQDAADLMVQPPVTVWIEPPPTDAPFATLQRPARFDAVLALREGAVVRER